MNTSSSRARTSDSRTDSSRATRRSRVGEWGRLSPANRRAANRNSRRNARAALRSISA